MINKIKIKNFKIHKNLELSLSKLNLLTGMNGSGKSSIIQSLLLLRQTYQAKNALEKGLLLNGDLVEIGKNKDAFCKYADDNRVEFSFYLEDRVEEIKWSFSGDANPDSNFMPLKNKNIDLNSLENFSLFNRNFQYISAEHIGPQNVHKPNDFEVLENYQMSSIKGKAEWHVHFLDFYKNQHVLPDMLHPKTYTDETGVIHNQLFYQVQLWLNEVCSNIKINLEISAQKEFYLAYGLGTDKFLATNVGFGISYVLPIFISILSATKDSLIIIENPESHLHPKGQSKLGELFGLAARSGVQMIIETHSDHIIHGVLKSIKNNIRTKGEKGASNKDLTINFFDRTDNNEVKTHTLNLNEDGFVANPPRNFFDQYNIDLDYLLYNPQKTYKKP